MGRVIVTGATGFIGSWLVQELLNNEYEVTLIVRNKKKLLSEFLVSSKCVIIEKSVEELQETDFIYEYYDAFFHLAWGGVLPEQKNDLEIQLKNVKMSLIALEISKKIKCKRFIASGTVAEYVLCGDVMDLNSKQTPNDLYGASKVSAYYFLEVRARQLKQDFNWIVISSTFGPRRVDNNIITYTIRSLKNGEKPVYGLLNQMWDFLYVGEVVRAIRMIAEKGKVNKVYGIGSGQFKPLRDYIEDIRDIINPEMELGIGEREQKNGDTLSSCVNIYDLIADTGFIPKVSFVEGIEMTIASF